MVRSGRTAVMGLLLRVSANLKMALSAKKASYLSLIRSSTLRASALTSRACSCRTGIRKALKLSQNLAVSGALVDSSGNLRLTARMTLISLCLMNYKYSFSYCYAVAVMESRKSWCSRHCWYSSQLESWKWLWPRSDSSRTSFRTNLKSPSVSMLLELSQTRKESMFWIAQQQICAFYSYRPNCYRLETIGFRVVLLYSRGVPQREVSREVAFETSLEMVVPLLRLLMDPQGFLESESSVGAPEDFLAIDRAEPQWLIEDDEGRPTAKSKAYSYSLPMRLASLIWHALLTNSTALLLLTDFGKAISAPNLSTSSFSVSTSCGVLPTSIQQRTIPIAYISDFSEQQFFLRDSGAIQRGVPTLTRSLKANLLLTAKPKSEIFHLFPARRTLAGLISRCITPQAIRQRQALQSCPAISRALLSDSCRFCAMYSLRLPWGQYQRTRQQWWEVLIASMSLTTCSWSSPRWTLISSQSMSMLLPRNFFSSITLIATRMCGLSTYTPLQTRLEKPLPSYYPLSYLNLPTRTSVSRRPPRVPMLAFQPVRVRGRPQRAATRRLSLEKLRIDYKVAEWAENERRSGKGGQGRGSSLGSDGCGGRKKKDGLDGGKSIYFTEFGQQHTRVLRYG